MPLREPAYVALQPFALAQDVARRCILLSQGEDFMRPRSTCLWLEALEPRVVPTIYAIGPVKPYLTLHEFPWKSLKPGDTVKVFYDPNFYHDKVQLAVSGTPWAPITI